MRRSCAVKPAFGTPLRGLGSQRYSWGDDLHHRHDDARSKSRNFSFKRGRTSSYVANTLLDLQRNGQAFINIIRRAYVGVSTTTSPWHGLSVTGTVGFDGLAGSTGAGVPLCLEGSKRVVCTAPSRRRGRPSTTSPPFRSTIWLL